MFMRAHVDACGSSMYFHFCPAISPMYFLCMVNVFVISQPTFSPHFSARGSRNLFGSSMSLHVFTFYYDRHTMSSEAFWTKLKLLGIFHPRTGGCAMDLVALGWNIPMSSIGCLDRSTWWAGRNLAVCVLTLLLGLLRSQAALLKNNGHQGAHGHG